MHRRTLFFALALLLLATTFSSPGVRAQTNDRAQAAAEIESLREKIKAREAVLLAPAPEDQTRYAEFLTQSHTGLVRLLPREKWVWKLSTPGDGAYYSFTHLTHDYGNGSDISLEQGYFKVGFAGANFGFLVNLGDVPLENISLDSEAVRPLAEFQTPTPEKGAREQQRRAGAGFREGERMYIDRLTEVADRTYALRSVNYETSDVLVAFRVVREDDDGSVVLLWKLLKKYPKPTLERNAAPAAGQ
ncbi:MAG TPA: hypothetical protein VHU19_06255 [Pyrinomonadaceae bacterium]|jgi:hypothetical protein|nr:hypothetical protein [Pyrinomonadaceae bacterium]